MLRTANLFILILAFLLISCNAEEAPAEKTVAPVAVSAANPKDVQPAILNFLQAAGSYFKKHQFDSGRFEYLLNTSDKLSGKDIYNVVRHAGVVYALALYAQHTGDNQFSEVLQKASQYLWDVNIKAVDNTGHLAVWSVPGENFYVDSFGKAKLGSTGLALAGMIVEERIGGEALPLDKLQKLGEFLLYMQLEDGGFYASYHEKAGRVEPKKYQYYPGEAALGLCALYERDPQTKWLEGAIKAVNLPANNLEEMEKKAIDHWDLIAIAKIFDLLKAEGKDLSSYNHLMVYSRRLVERLLAEWDSSTVKGSFMSDYGTTPTATRIEGLTAIAPYLKVDGTLLEPTLTVIREACHFLINSQLKEGPYQGGIPMAVKKKEYENSKESRFAIDTYNKHAAEIRIDYVQHAMCALLGYDRLLQLGMYGE